MVKPDRIISSKQRLSGSAFQDRTATTSLLDFGRFDLPFVNTTGNPAESNDVHIQNFIVNHIYTISPTVVNNFRAAGFQLFLDDAAPGRGPTLQQLGATYPSFPLPDIPNISPSGRWFQGTGNFTSENVYAFEFSDDISYIHGNHSFKFGGGYRFAEYKQTATDNNPGIFLVEGTYSGNPLADMMLGHSLLYVSNDSIVGESQPNYDVYAAFGTGQSASGHSGVPRRALVRPYVLCCCPQPGRRIGATRSNEPGDRGFPNLYSAAAHARRFALRAGRGAEKQERSRRGRRVPQSRGASPGIVV